MLGERQRRARDSKAIGRGSGVLDPAVSGRAVKEIGSDDREETREKTGEESAVKMLGLEERVKATELQRAEEGEPLSDFYPGTTESWKTAWPIPRKLPRLSREAAVAVGLRRL